MATPQTSRFHDLLRRLTLAKDLSFPSVLEDLFPMVDMLADKPELFRGRGELPFSAAVGIVANAGVVNRAWLMNKAAGNLAVVTHLIVGSATGQDIVANIVNTGLPADVVNLTVGLDSRNADASGVNRSRCTMGTDTNAAATAGGIRFSVNNLGMFAPIPMRVVLSPGFALRVETVNPNTTLVVMFMGYERSVDATELT